MHNRQVSVHINAGDEEDAEVEVVVVEHPHGHAERQPQPPAQVVQVVVDEEGQGQEPEGVSKGQVEEEYRAACPAAQTVEENPEGEQVEGQSEENHRQEEGRHHIKLDPSLHSLMCVLVAEDFLWSLHGQGQRFRGVKCSAT